MFRVYDNQDKKWIKENIYLSPNPNSDLYISKNNIFGFSRISLASSSRYILHKSTGMHDKNGFIMYEGDFVDATVDEDRVVRGMISFSNEVCAYVILCFECDEYFALGENVSEYIEIIGNVFDGVNDDKI